MRLVLVCLFVWGFSSHSRIYHPYGDVIIAGEGLQILTCAQHLWPLSSEGSLACHTYCIVHLRGPVTLTPTAVRLTVELSLPVFMTKFCRGWDSNTQPSACPLRHRRDLWS